MVNVRISRPAVSAIQNSRSPSVASSVSVSGEASVGPSTTGRDLILSTNAASVGAAKSIRAGTRRSRLSDTRCASMTARRLLPPSAKKLSLRPMGTPSTSAQIAATRTSNGSCGASLTSVLDCCLAHSNSALRSTFPARFRGITATGVIPAGSMWAGRRAERYSARSVPDGAGSPGRKNARSTLPPSTKVSTSTTASATAGCERNVCSISPSSTRWPFNLI